MKTIFISLLLATLCLVHHPLSARSISPFTSHPSLTTTKILHFDGRIQDEKVLLSWTVGENERTGMFELQRSTDGKNFTTAALVFGTDKEDVDSYKFYEKTKSKKVSYRLKIIYKDHTVAFSQVIDVKSPAK
jgi:hypothetical protein